MKIRTQCSQYSHIGGERIQCLVKVVHLHHNAERDNDTEDVRAGMCELVITSKCQFDSNTETFDSHNGNRADQRANRDIHNGIFTSVFWHDRVDHEKGEDDNTEAV
jgi:hypothetical protein